MKTSFWAAAKPPGAAAGPNPRRNYRTAWRLQTVARRRRRDRCHHQWQRDSPTPLPRFSLVLRHNHRPKSSRSCARPTATVRRWSPRCAPCVDGSPRHAGLRVRQPTGARNRGRRRRRPGRTHIGARSSTCSSPGWRIPPRPTHGTPRDVDPDIDRASGPVEANRQGFAVQHVFLVVDSAERRAVTDRQRD